MAALIECLLCVNGDSAFLNAFDKTFRSGYGPQWADRPAPTGPRYSFHALFPVPEEVQHRGLDAAGRLWCSDYWDSVGDLQEMQVKRVPGERRYRFFTPERHPKNLVRIVSHDYPVLVFHLAVLERGREHLHQYIFTNGRYHGGYCRNTGGTFASIRKEMGFAP